MTVCGVTVWPFSRHKEIKGPNAFRTRLKCICHEIALSVTRQTCTWNCPAEGWMGVMRVCVWGGGGARGGRIGGMECVRERERGWWLNLLFGGTWRRANVQQLTCRIGLSCYCFSIAFVHLSLKHYFYAESPGENFLKVLESS